MQAGNNVNFPSNSSSVPSVTLCGLVLFLPLDEPIDRSCPLDDKQPVPCLGIKTSVWSNNHTTPVQNINQDFTCLSRWVFFLLPPPTWAWPRIQGKVRVISSPLPVTFDPSGFGGDDEGSNREWQSLICLVPLWWYQLDTARSKRWVCLLNNFCGYLGDPLPLFQLGTILHSCVSYNSVTWWDRNKTDRQRWS